MLAGLALTYVSVHNVASTAGLFAPTSPLSSSGPPLVFSMGSVVLSGVFQVVVGLLWVALGVALWRHASENQNVGTTPLIS